MIKHYPFASHGHARYSWLDTYYHFSFAEYHNPARIHFGQLRVFNDDTIAPKSGFSPHSHRDMEIITYVREGAITHEDSEGNRARIEAREVQVMTAGSGITHAEYNLESVTSKMFQVWIMPEQKGLAPSWQKAKLPDDTMGLTLMASGRHDSPLRIHQHADFYVGELSAGTQLEQTLSGDAYIVISKGVVHIDNTVAQPGDAVEVTQQDTISLEALENAEIILIVL